MERLAPTISADAEFALALTSTANAAITARWGEQTTPLVYGLSTQLAADAILAGIALVVAEKAIRVACERSKQQRPPRSIEYFRERIWEAAQVEQSRAYAAGRTAPAGDQPRGGPPTSLANTLRDQEASRALDELRKNYDDERRRAARTWAEDAANADALAAITDTAKSQSVFPLDSKIGLRTLEATIVQKCGEACGFPDFDAWAKARST